MAAVEEEEARRVREIVEEEVPEWSADDSFAEGRFKAFTGQRRDWDDRLHFWRGLILTVARRLDCLVLHTDSVQQKWFVRDGVVPMGVQRVLVEMKKSGELVTVEQILGDRPSTVQWIGGMLTSAIVWAGLQLLPDDYQKGDGLVEERLVVLPVLQERVSQFVKSLADTHYSSFCIATLDSIKGLCGGAEVAELVIGYLLLQDKARFVTVAGRDQIEGFKISLNENPVKSVSESDRHVLQLNWTMEMLALRMRTFDGRIFEAKTSVRRSMRAGCKSDALRYGRRMKLLQGSREQCAGSMDKIEQVLGIISDAESSKQVSEAMRVGATAIKENHVSLEEVNHTLDELDVAIAAQKETGEALGAASLSTIEANDDAALDEELAGLEVELEAENLDLPEVPQIPVVQEPPGRTLVSEEGELQQAFAKLELELG